MSKTSDSGHATNVANFEKIATFAIDLGAAYNPSKDSIKLPALLALVEQSKATHKAANPPLPRDCIAWSTKLYSLFLKLNR